MIISKSNIKGTITANPSKSHEQRLFCCALLSNGISTINNIGHSDDVRVFREISENMGACINISDNTAVIEGGLKKNEKIFCGESAFCARLFTPVSCIVNNDFTVTGEKTLLNRPVCEDFEILKQMNCEYHCNENKLPVKFSKAGLMPGIYEINNPVSSQFISGLLMSMPLLKADSKLIINNPVSIPYLLMTLDCMEKSGVKTMYKISDNKLIVHIFGNQKYAPVNADIEGDWSSAVFFIVAAAINGQIKISGLNINSKQADKDILNVMEKAKIKYSYDNGILFVEKSTVNSFDFNAINCPDIIPALIILAIFANGESKIKGANRLKIKETSRALVMQNELNKLGIKISIDDNCITVIGLQKQNGGTINSHGDHRIAMALSILALNNDNSVKIENHNCVSKSYPDFYNDLKKTGANIYE